MAMDDGQIEDYWKLRDAMLTPRYLLQDYGVMLVGVGLRAVLFLRKRHVPISAPRRAQRLSLSAALPRWQRSRLSIRSFTRNRSWRVPALG